MSDDQGWNQGDSDWAAWLAEHPYDAEFRQETEGTIGYQIHIMSRRLGPAGTCLREWFDSTRNRALVRALRATGDHDLADRIARAAEGMEGYCTCDRAAGIYRDCGIRAHREGPHPGLGRVAVGGGSQ